MQILPLLFSHPRGAVGGHYGARVGQRGWVCSFKGQAELLPGESLTETRRTSVFTPRPPYEAVKCPFIFVKKDSWVKWVKQESKWAQMLCRNRCRHVVPLTGQEWSLVLLAWTEFKFMNTNLSTICCCESCDSKSHGSVFNRPFPVLFYFPL